jgi:PEP-CTERM motif
LGLFSARASVTDFNFGYTHVFAPQADTYLQASSNVRKYGEWQSPAVTYWGPTANELPSSLTYYFDFGAPSARVSLVASLASFNFVWGNANGWSSLWASKNGVDYSLLLNNPTPTSYVDSYMTYSNSLPTALLGSSSLYVQIRMQVSGSPSSSYTTAQFGRSSSANTANVFQVTASTVPEPSTYALLALGAGVLMLAKRRQLHR